MRLRVVIPVPDHRVAAASRATDALWPAVLAYQGEALRVIEQGCEVDRVHCGHDDRNPPCSPAAADRLEPSSYPNPLSRASITPETDKSLIVLRVIPGEHALRQVRHDLLKPFEDLLSGVGIDRRVALFID